MQNKLWLSVIAAGWLSVAGASSIIDLRRNLDPATDWLSVSEVHVHDALVGEPPVLSVKRVIKRPFFGEWIATVRRASDGTLAFACLAEGRASYATDAKLPPGLNMDWWTFPTKCRLEPGRYRLDTDWRIWPPDHPLKQLRVQSNIFEVRRPDIRP